MIELYAVFFLIGAGSFGGGMTAVSLVIHEVVQQRAWLSAAEMNEVIAIAQMTPGPIAINSATFVGYRLAGVPGAFTATLAVITPALLVLSLFVLLIKLHTHLTDANNEQLGKRIKHSLRPGILAMILFAVWSIGSNAVVSWQTGLIACAGLAMLLKFKKMHPVVVVIAGGVLGVMFL